MQIAYIPRFIAWQGIAGLAKAIHRTIHRNRKRKGGATGTPFGSSIGPITWRIRQSFA